MELSSSKRSHYVDSTHSTKQNAFLKWSFHNNTAYFAGQVPEKTVKQNCLTSKTKEVLSLIDKLLAEIGSEKVKFLPRKSSLRIMAD